MSPLSKVSRLVVGAVALAVLSPALAVSSAAAATPVGRQGVTTVSPSVSLGLCRIWPQLCHLSTPQVVGGPSSR